MNRPARGMAAFLGALAWTSCGSPPRATSRELLTWDLRFMRNDAWEQKLGQRVEIDGIAQNGKLGAMVDDLWVEGLLEWPADVHGKKIRVTGTLIRRDDLPVFRPGPDDPAKGGIPVPEGIDLERARRRYVIAEARWTKLPD